ncbi:unnamed protein product [Ambrosiozyma monospora]|uniref:Unnamed protein product n=1 Tax=Ambrosiozyma monospora TaxID=43982 RepID=A0A9W6YUQ0_AMBMO|nr:unnamed protein product [Ambrosiozyma monospora]
MNSGLIIIIVILSIVVCVSGIVALDSKSKNIQITETPIILSRSQQVNLDPEYTHILQHEQQRQHHRQSQPQLPLRSILKLPPPPPYAAKGTDQEGLQLDPTSSTTVFSNRRDFANTSSPIACNIQRPPNSYQSPSRPDNPYEAQFVFPSGPPTPLSRQQCGSGGRETPPPEYTFSSSNNGTYTNTGT